MFNEFADQWINVAPRLDVRGAQGAADAAFRRNRVVRITGVNGAEREHGACTRVDASRQQARQIDNQFAQCIDNIGCHLRTGGMPARAMHLNLQGVGRRSDGTCSNADVTYAQLRLTVDGKNTLDAIECTGSDNLGRSANHDFLCWLENET